jgi:hypothetical protein
MLSQMIAAIEGASAEVSPLFDGVRIYATFPNGYSASIIKHGFSKGSRQGMYEGAVYFGGKIVYDTPITDDVVGYLSEMEAVEFAESVSKLPVREVPNV